MTPNDKIDSEKLSRAFSFAKEKEKAMHGLEGILSGIVADQKLNKQEILYLDTWVISQQYLAGESDARDILISIGAILERGSFNSEDLQQLQTSIDKIVRSKQLHSIENVARVYELIGFLKGITADSVLNEKEVEALANWIEENRSIKRMWPASVVVRRLKAILDDGVIVEQDREDLLQTLNQLTSIHDEKTGVTYRASTEVWEDQVDMIHFAGSVFCLTGDFVTGDRTKVTQMLQELGAKTSSSMNNNVDYLLIGTLASRDWLYTSHGRKIEKALLIKQQGQSVKIITERRLLQQLR